MQITLNLGLQVGHTSVLLLVAWSVAYVEYRSLSFVFPLYVCPSIYSYEWFEEIL